MSKREDEEVERVERPAEKPGQDSVRWFALSAAPATVMRPKEYQKPSQSFLNRRTRDQEFLDSP